MKLLQTNQNNHGIRIKFSPPWCLPIFFNYAEMLMLVVFIFFSGQSNAQETGTELRAGTWTPLTNLAPDPNEGVMLLLSAGTVMVKSFSSEDPNAGIWNRLTPNLNGS